MSSPFQLPELPARPDDAHKGTFGTVVVFGGSATMIGAPALAAGAALRSGAGLVKIATAENVLPLCLTIEPSATGMMLPHVTDTLGVSRLLAQVDERAVLAVGPGMGVSEDQQAWLTKLLAMPRTMVLDADGLNNLAAIGPGATWHHRALILTPHPGEYRRLAAAARIIADPVDPAQRERAAHLLADGYHAVIVLKGHRTVVSDGRRVYVNTSGNAALATAGSGDILTGVIASLLAQGMERFEAAMLGVYLHGLAADLWAQQYGPAGLVARDLAALLPRAMALHRQRPR